MNRHASIDSFSRVFQFMAGYALLLCLTMLFQSDDIAHRISEYSGGAAFFLLLVVGILHRCKVKSVHPLYIVLPAIAGTALLGGAFVLHFSPILYF